MRRAGNLLSVRGSPAAHERTERGPVRIAPGPVTGGRSDDRRVRRQRTVSASFAFRSRSAAASSADTVRTSAVSVRIVRRSTA